MYCPQGSGTLRQQLLMRFGIAWYCMVFHGIAWYCMVLHSIAWYCIALHGIVWHCMVLHGIAWHCMALCGIVTPCPAYGLPCPLNKPQNPTQMHPLYSLHQHISLFRVQITTRRANPLHLLWINFMEKTLNCQPEYKALRNIWTAPEIY